MYLLLLCKGIMKGICCPSVLEFYKWITPFIKSHNVMLGLKNSSLMYVFLIFMIVTSNCDDSFINMMHCSISCSTLTV